jgi:hypothetical protein
MFGLLPSGISREPKPSSCSDRNRVLRFNLACARNAVALFTTTEWDSVCAQPRTVTDFNGRQTTYEYDNLCRRTREIRPLLDFTYTEYKNIGNPDTQYVETRGYRDMISISEIGPGAGLMLRDDFELRRCGDCADLRRAVAGCDQGCGGGGAGRRDHRQHL